MEFKHPKYYKELRKLRNKLDQAISKDASTEATSVRPGPGLKLEATSDKQQASSPKLRKFQATSSKPGVPSTKPEVTSSLIREPGTRK